MKWLNRLTSSVLRSCGIESDNIINVINSDGNFYGDFVTSKYNVRPAMYLNGNLEIVSGVGSEYGPYELGEVNEQSEKVLSSIDETKKLINISTTSIISEVDKASNDVQDYVRYESQFLNDRLIEESMDIQENITTESLELQKLI